MSGVTGQKRNNEIFRQEQYIEQSVRYASAAVAAGELIQKP